VLTFLNNRLPEEAYAYVNTSMQGHAQAQLEKVSCIEVDFAQARSLGLIVDSKTLAHESKFYVFRSVGYSERGKLEIYHNEHALFASHRTEESNGKMRKFAVIAAVSGAYFSEAFSSCS